MSEIKIPTRNEIPEHDKWDLSQLFKSDDEWEAELETWHQKDTPANVAHLKQSIEEIKLGETVSVSIQSLKERLKAAGHA